MRPRVGVSLLLGALLAAAGEEARPYRLAADYSAARGGLSMLVLKNGEVVFDEVHNGFPLNGAHELASGAKSFWGVLAMMGVADGLLQLDEAAAQTLKEWKPDPRKSRITIRQLLNLSAGIDPATSSLRSPRVKNKYTFAVNVEAVAEPGEKFKYGPSYYFAFGELLRRKLEPRSETVEEYLHRKILDPIGLEVRNWSKDGAGNIQLPFGATLTAREWIKFGELIRLHGRWQGKQLIDRKLLEECFQPSPANPSYGLTFWLRPSGVVQASGAGRQRLYVIRSRDLVVVRQGIATRPVFKDEEFLLRLLDGKAEEDVTKTAAALVSEATRARVNKEFAADTSGDGTLQREEFPPENLRYFDAVDLDGDGNVTKQELALKLTHYGRQLERNR